MLSGVRPSEAWIITLFPPVHGFVRPSDQPWPFFGLSVRHYWFTKIMYCCIIRGLKNNVQTRMVMQWQIVLPNNISCYDRRLHKIRLDQEYDACVVYHPNQWQRGDIQCLSTAYMVLSNNELFHCMMVSSNGSFFSALLALCAGNSLVTGAFPSQRAINALFDPGPHTLLNKQSNDRWFETRWRSCDVIIMGFVWGTPNKVSADERRRYMYNFSSLPETFLNTFIVYGGNMRTYPRAMEAG